MCVPENRCLNRIILRFVTEPTSIPPNLCYRCEESNQKTKQISSKGIKRKQTFPHKPKHNSENSPPKPPREQKYPISISACLPTPTQKTSEDKRFLTNKTFLESRERAFQYANFQLFYPSMCTPRRRRHSERLSLRRMYISFEMNPSWGGWM